MFVTSKRKKEALIRGLIIGGTVGSIFTLLFTPKSGHDVRGDIKDGVDKSIDAARRQGEKLAAEAKTAANDITTKANQLLKLTKDYASGKYKGTSEAFMNEYQRLRAAVASAIDTYRHYETGTTDTENMVEDIFEGYSNESLPKHEGMGRRKM
ncbi:MAG: YtxH domain-containing protein [Bacteroidota bacterium]